MQVETINDQYMVAGGLPDQYTGHATEICLMAVDLLNAVTGITVPQMSGHVLQLQIGIHTGRLHAVVVLRSFTYLLLKALYVVR